jgi:lantibiotic biosynthesis protein
MLNAAGSGDAATSQRWRLGVCGVDRLLADLGLDLKARLGVVTLARAGMAPPTGPDPEREHQLSQDFRRERQTLETLLRGDLSPEDPLSAVLKPLEARSARLVPLGRKLQELLQAGRLSQSLGEFSQGCIHMHINRLLRSHQQERELVIYDALARLYESILVRESAAPTANR